MDVNPLKKSMTKTHIKEIKKIIMETPYERLSKPFKQFINSEFDTFAYIKSLLLMKKEQSK